MMYRLFSTLCAAVLLGSLQAEAIPYTNLYVFGDNFEDIGNSKGYVNPGGGGGTGSGGGPRYIGGGKTNGKIYTEVLYGFLGLGIMKPSSDGGTNYAWATTGDVTYPGEGDKSVRDQIGEYLATLEDEGVDPDALYLVNGPLGNYFNDALAYTSPNTGPAAKEFIEAQAESTIALLRMLIGVGAVHIIVPQKVEPGQFLGDLVLSETQRALFDRIRLATETYNTTIGNLIVRVKSDSTRIILVPFQSWVAAARAEGLILNYGSAPEPPEIFNEYFNLLGFGTSGYNTPTAAAHAILAEIILPLLNREPSIANQIGDLMLSIEDDPLVINLETEEVFLDEDEDALTYIVSTRVDSVVQAIIDKAVLTLVPIADGTTSVTIRAQDGGPKKIPMSFQVTVLSIPGTISLSVESADFGDVEIKTDATVTITIENTGEGPLNVTDVTTDIAGVTPTETEFTIPVGESHDLILTFSPTIEGEVTGTLTILSNDAENGSLSLALSGSAIVILADARTDFNGDGQLNLTDFILFAQNYGSSNPDFDLSDNGRVDLADFILFVQNYTRPLQ